MNKLELLTALDNYSHKGMVIRNEIINLNENEINNYLDFRINLYETLTKNEKETNIYVEKYLFLKSLFLFLKKIYNSDSYNQESYETLFKNLNI